MLVNRNLISLPKVRPRALVSFRSAQVSLLALVLSCWMLCLPAYAVPNTAEGNQAIPIFDRRADSIDRKVVARIPILHPEGMQPEDVVQRPFLYWRSWANQRLPFHRVASFLLFTLTFIYLLMGGSISSAQVHYQNRWLRSLGIGLLVLVVGVAAVTFLSRMGLYTPLAVVVLAAVQFMGLLGLAVVSLVIGRSILGAVHISERIKNVLLRDLVCLWIGALLLSLLVFIPGIGVLPRLGNRILALLSAAGAGAIFTHLRARFH